MRISQRYVISIIKSKLTNNTFLGIKNIKRREARRITPINSLKTEGWIEWLQYFLTPPRDFLRLQVCNVSCWGDVYKLKCLRQSFGYETREPDDSLENPIFSIEDCSGSSGSSQSIALQTDQEIDRSIAISSDPGSQILPGVRGKPRIDNKVELIEHLMKNIKLLLCVPFESSCHCSSWVNNHNLFIYDNANPEYKLACASIQRQTANYNFKQILELHNQSPNPTYYARTPNHYLNLADSIKFVEELLNFQYPGEVKEFITRLYNICERILPKRNSMFIMGKPNSGKTWFFDMVSGFYLNIGNVKNVVRGQNFPFNDCVNRRILIWNEPSICPSGFDSVKMLAGGDPCPAAVKYQGDSTITRTPLFFTSNKDIFPKVEVWNSRMFYEHWKPCSILKEVVGYPSPRTLDYLFNKYL